MTPPLFAVITAGLLLMCCVCLHVNAEVCENDAVLAGETVELVAPGLEHFNSSAYWENRYRVGQNSGVGSYGSLAIYKASVINELVVEKDIVSVYEHGCGDGNNLLLYTSIQTYTAGDVSETVIRARKKEHQRSSSKTFIHLNAGTNIRATKADMVMSLDVLYHLIDRSVFITYLEDIFSIANKYVLIYAHDGHTYLSTPKHVSGRDFTPFVKARFPCWKLERVFQKPKTLKSFAEFYLYSRV
jgi:hypothetical protein